MWQNPTGSDEEAEELAESPYDEGEITGTEHIAQDWMNTNFMSPQAIAPRKRRRAPSPIPDTRLLFQVQDDILKAITAFKKLPVDQGEEDSDYMKARKRLGTQLENSYKLMNRYLRTYVNQEPT